MEFTNELNIVKVAKERMFVVFVGRMAKDIGVVVTVKKADAWLSSGEKPTSNITAVNPVDDVMNRLNKTILWISDISFFVLFWYMERKVW